MKFFKLVWEDVKKLWDNNKLSAILVGCMFIVGLLCLIPAVESVVMVAMTIITIGFLALGTIAALVLLFFYIKEVIKRTKQ